MPTRRLIGPAAICGYVLAVVAANWLTARYGFVSVGFGLMTAAGTYAAGLALLARDVVQDTAGRLAVLLAIAAGALLSVWLSTPQLAVASGVAFLLAECCDMAVYTPLRERGWARAVLVSNLIGAVVDTVVFLWLAGFPIRSAAPGQLVGKILWATALPVAAVVAWRWGVRRRVVLRESMQQRAGA